MGQEDLRCPGNPAVSAAAMSFPAVVMWLAVRGTVDLFPAQILSDQSLPNSRALAVPGTSRLKYRPSRLARPEKEINKKKHECHAGPVLLIHMLCAAVNLVN